MTTDKKTHQCFICFKKFQMEEHIYDGKWIQSYQIEVCMSCWQSNRDGWAPHNTERIIKHLEKKGIPIPQKDEEGRLPRN